MGMHACVHMYMYMCVYMCVHVGCVDYVMEPETVFFLMGRLWFH